jgi:hypothetical protein
MDSEMAIDGATMDGQKKGVELNQTIDSVDWIRQKSEIMD